MRGDIIFVSRYNVYGDFLYMKSAEGLYRHYGVDVGNDQVIHFRNNKGESTSSARIIITSSKEFAQNDKIEKCYRVNYKYSSDEIVQRAYSELGSDFGGYNLINNNCEHFANWCANGKKTSSQVPINDDQDIVEKAIDRAFEPLLKTAEKADKVLDYVFSIFK